MSTDSADAPLPRRRPRLSVEALVAAKRARPIVSLADLDSLSANLFSSEEELEEFLAFTYAERRRDAA